MRSHCDIIVSNQNLIKSCYIVYPAYSPKFKLPAILASNELDNFDTTTKSNLITTQLSICLPDKILKSNTQHFLLWKEAY